MFSNLNGYFVFNVMYKYKEYKVIKEKRRQREREIERILISILNLMFPFINDQKGNET